eukprot:12914134-Prorocentrum_lima.AAC.1
MKLEWGTDRVALVGRDGEEIILSLHFGLPLWEDVANNVRKRLAKRHLAGRHKAPVTPPTINLV